MFSCAELHREKIRSGYVRIKAKLMRGALNEDYKGGQRRVTRDRRFNPLQRDVDVPGASFKLVKRKNERNEARGMFSKKFRQL